MSFVHLHVHSHYSLLKASSTIEALVQKCEKSKMPALALTDYGNLFGALELYFKCKEKNIKPIIGLEIYLVQNRLEKKKKVLHHESETLVLLAQNQKGYKNLCHISTIGYQEGFYYIPRIDIEILKKFNDGLLVLTGGHIGKIFKVHQNFGNEKALDEIIKLKNIFHDRLYLEYTKTNSDVFNQFLKQTAHHAHLPLVASNDVHYVEKQDHIIQDVLFCIGNNKVLEDETREKLIQKDFDFKSSKEMLELFKDEPQVVQNTLEVAQRCQLDFKLKSKGKPIYHLPIPHLEKKKSIELELRYLAEKGLDHYIQENSSQFDEKNIKKYKDRLNKELKIIHSMGFSGYFLIVREFVHWAKKQGIPVGPGRGSGASSLVAYSLGITYLDPMPHNLLFERFLNPERISMPDFDIDFCQENRNKVIRHVHNTYGKNFVAQVITFGRLQARAAIRDVGRILGMPYRDVDSIAKLIPDRLGIKISTAVEQNSDLKELIETDSQIATLVDLAQRIEGLVRHVSTHAAGVIIADRPILNYAPLYKEVEGENIIQFDLKYAKKIGLVKFDFLGLKTLTHIHEAFCLIQSNRGKNVNVQDISIKDPGIYEVINNGDTLGIFQFEGYGITDLIRKAQPKCFEDIVAVNALFRPGPMDMIHFYLERRKSKTARYIFPELEPILKETHGIIVYQEQVLLISALIAGYSFAEADVLRRAMAEKISSEMKKQKNRFLNGSVKRGYDLKKAEKLFNLVAEFAKYGFNKAHATAYCVLTTQTAWLKCYYPVEFFASLLTVEMGDAKKITKYIKNAKEHGIFIRSPHVNYSQYVFSVKGDEIYFALGAIKGVGQSAVQNIVSVRESLENKQFKSLDHFLESIDAKKVNRKAMDSLVKAGAFDKMGYSRAEILSNFDQLFHRAEKKKKDSKEGQSDLFSFSKEEESVVLAHSQKWSKLEEMNHEKNVIGFFLSCHPLDYFKYFTDLHPGNSIQDIKRNKIQNIKVWGMINDLKETLTRKGDTMAFAQLEDKTGYLNLVFFSKVYLDLEKLLRVDEPVYLEGFLRSEDISFKCIVEKVTPLSSFLSRVRQVEIQVSKKTEKSILNNLKIIMKESEGKIPIVFKLDVNGSSFNLRSKDPAGIDLNFSVLEKIKKIVPEKNIRLL